MPRAKTRHFELYNAVKAAGDWITRPDLAIATGKRNLSPNDTRHLHALAEQGYIEEQQFVIANRMFYRYRVPEGALVLEED